MKHRLTIFNLALVLTSLESLDAFRSIHRPSRIRTTLNRPPTKLQMNLEFLEPLFSSVLIPPAAEISTAGMLQAVGETSLAGMVSIAGMQGALIMKQYQTNPCGGLIVPPGLTHGDEDATQSNDSNPCIGLFPESERHAEAYYQQSSLSDADIEEMVCGSTDSTVICALKKQWYHVATKSMALAVVPLAMVAGPSLGLAAWVVRYGHLIHLAVIFGLTHIYDFFRKLPAMDAECTTSQCSNTCSDGGSIFQGNHPRILVLGDSMCVGIGTCEVFDDQKLYGIPLHKEEHLAVSEEDAASSKSLPGPIFPKALAKTLSKRFQKPVSWRSAGVDGGATQDIAEHLLSVVKDEVDKGQAPDLVVVLTGSNDLKHILDGSASVKGFRSNLMKLAKDIRVISPTTRVVYPALPTYRMDQKSVLNVFPLSICLDTIMGLWDAQKMAVADKYPGIMHVDLTVKDVNSWYNSGVHKNTDEPVSLISSDGIHPNARCYNKWGEFVGNNLADQILQTKQHQTLQHYNKHIPSALQLEC